MRVVLFLTSILATVALINIVQDPSSKLMRKEANIESDNLQLLIAEEKEKSATIAKSLAHLASAQSDDSVTKAFLESFKICGQCSKFERWGPVHDGGYVMCTDGLNKDNIKAAYSLGVAGEDKWADAVGDKLDVPINQFDCTIQAAPEKCKGCTFYKKCIVGKEGEVPLVQMGKHKDDGMTFNQALQETSQANAPEGSLLLKMDIEGSEWSIYAEEQSENLKKFGQIIVEFHNLQQQDKHQQYLKAMQTILGAGFRVAHLHGNDCCPMFNWQGTSIPSYLEVTFMKGDARSGCLPL